MLVSEELSEDSPVAPLGYHKGRYTLIVTPIHINECADMDIEYRLIDNHSNTIIGIVEGYAEGSTRFTFDQKIILGMDDAGDSFGTYFKKLF